MEECRAALMGFCRASGDMETGAISAEGPRCENSAADPLCSLQRLTAANVNRTGDTRPPGSPPHPPRPHVSVCLLDGHSALVCTRATTFKCHAECNFTRHMHMSVTVRAPLWSIKGVYTPPPPQARATTQPESEKYSLTERKGLSSDIVPDGWSLWLCGSIYIFV